MVKILFSFFFIISITTYSQDTIVKKNPILYGDLILGLSAKQSGDLEFMGGAAINYQYKDNLFSLRYIENTRNGVDVVMIAPFIAIPFPYRISTHNEYAALYGIREIIDGHSFSISAGVSYNNLTTYFRDENNERYTNTDNYIGLPFEFDFRWFKKEKKRYHVYYVIPVGKPTAIGNSFGFKVVGNISKHSYIGLGMVFGFGMHKVYQ